MNNTFSFKRFGKVVKKDFFNIWPLYGLSMLVFALIPVAVWMLLYAAGANNVVSPESRRVLIVLQVLLTASFAPEKMYRTCNLGKDGIYFAMLPASKLEKYLSMLLFTFIVCPIIMFVVAYAVDMLLYLLPFGPYKDSLGIASSSFATYYFSASLIGGRSDIWSTILGYIDWVAPFVFGATIFKKHKFFNTILWEILICFVLSIIGILILSNIIENHSEEFVHFFDRQEIIAIIPNIIYWVTLIIAVAFSALLLWGAAHRLKKMTY